MRKVMVAALAVALSTGVLSAADDKYGAGVTLATATPISMLLAQPETYAGKTVRVDGVVTAVCEKMGCWMSIGDEATKQTIRMRVAHGAIVFPVSAKGKQASVEGVFDLAEKIGKLINHDEDEKAHHADAMKKDDAKKADMHAPGSTHGGAPAPGATHGGTHAPADAAAAPAYEMHAVGAIIK